MKTIKEKLQSYPEIANLLLFLFGACMIVFCVNNIFYAFAPFIIAYVVTKILRPLMLLMRKKIKTPNIVNAITCMFVFIVVAGGVIWLFSYYMVEGIRYLIDILSSEETISNVITVAHEIGINIQDAARFFNVEIGVNEASGVIGDVIKNLVTALSNVSVSIVTQIPNLLISFVIGCVAAFYMLCDYDKISAAIKNRLSGKVNKIISICNNKVLSSFIKMVMSYVLISAICFCELLVGFITLGVDNCVLIALIVAILDVLPILGSGAVLVPWGIISLLMGKPFVGIGLLVLWVVILIVRQILEPKIVGSQIGLYPLVTLISLYVGLKLMGGIGLIVGPMYVIACKELCEEGVISFKKKIAKIGE